MKILIPFGIVAWLLCGAVGAGFFLASLRADFPNLYKDPKWALKQRNKIVATGAFFGPVGLVILGSANGFGYPDGWTWTAEPLK